MYPSFFYQLCVGQNSLDAVPMIRQKYHRWAPEQGCLLTSLLLTCPVQSLVWLMDRKWSIRTAAVLLTSTYFSRSVSKERNTDNTENTDKGVEEVISTTQACHP